MSKNPEDYNNISIVCKKCGEFVIAEKIYERFKNAEGKMKQKTYRQLRCEKCGETYK